MNTQDNWQHQFDRLADGELSGNERRELLESLDASPARWRDCALVLIEANALRRSMQKVAAGDLTNASPMPMSTSELPTKPRAAALRSRGVWFATAASIAIAFVAGHFWNGATDKVEPRDRLAAHPAVEPKVEPEGKVDLASDDLLTVWTVDRDGNRKSFALPLVEADWIDEQVGERIGPIVSDDLRAQLRERGYNVESRRRFAPLVMENGQSYLLPVNDARLVPVSTPIY